jgi:hypothetical protein
LPGKLDVAVNFVYLHEDRLYIAGGKTLYVYSMTDLNSPLAVIPLGDYCFSGLIIDSRLYLSVDDQLQVYDLPSSSSNNLEPPLIRVKVIRTKSIVFKILRIGPQELLMGEEHGSLQILDMGECKISHSKNFGSDIVCFNDLVAIDDYQYLLAS